METASVHPAEAYLRDSKNPSSLYVKIEGKRRRLFINRESGAIGIIAPAKKKKGYLFNNWNAIEGILVPHKQESGKNGADCYSKNGHAVTVLMRQS